MLTPPSRELDGGGQRGRRQLGGPNGTIGQRDDRRKLRSEDLSSQVTCNPRLVLLLCGHRQTPTDTDVSLHCCAFGGKVIVTLPKCALTFNLV